MGFLAKFVLGYLACHAAYFAIPDEALRAVIHVLLAIPAAALIGALAPDEAVRAVAGTLSSPRATLEIVRGCDGAGAAFLLASAVLAYPGKPRQKLSGLLLGLSAVYVLNEFRLAGLYAVVAYRVDWFPLLHVYVAPLAVICCLASFFAWWVRRSEAQPNAPAVAA